MPEIPELTNGEFEKFVKDGVVLIDFFAEWCMPCMMMGPIVDDVSEQFFPKIKFGKINIEDNQEIADKFGVVSIPTFIVFKDGKVVKEMNGSMTEEELIEEIEEFL